MKPSKKTKADWRVELLKLRDEALLEGIETRIKEERKKEAKAKEEMSQS